MTALVAGGAETETVDISGLLDAARLLYDGAVVAQRYAAAGEFLETRPAGADPAVSDIVLGAKHPTGYQLVDDLDALTRAKLPPGNSSPGSTPYCFPPPPNIRPSLP